MSDSDLPSPMTLLQAQILVAKNKKAKKQQKKSSKKEKPGPAPEDHDSDKENDKSEDSISWAKNTALTDTLLTAIEESVRYRKAFGFKGGDMPGVTSGGMTVAQVCRELGRAILPKAAPPGNKQAADKLGNSVKNRVNALKRNYHDYHNQLSQTGHGLIMNGKTEEIIEGTPIHNVWQKMEARFPWYKRLHHLLSGSPVYDTSALANSMTPLDTDVLTSRITCATGRQSPDWNQDAMDNEFAKAAAAGEFQFDDDAGPFMKSSPTADDGLGSSQPPAGFPPTPAPASAAPAPTTPCTPSTTKATVEPLKSIPAKRKLNAVEQIAQMSENLHDARVKAEELKLEGKRRRAEIYSENKLALRCLEADEKERDRQHELQMMEKRILLATLQAGGTQGQLLSPPATGSYTLNPPSATDAIASLSSQPMDDSLNFGGYNFDF
ncbi:hypothetical protein LshimejAT787_0211740 [Lyophyllum shimeji]|uniref:Uncharacterized protein n=1 Tax=Lyophyllum shimeji TaxID=47721 RepID=A0A9P3PHM0_LYOSH|nr:hypothetical protein LshimejAT787_0211740 [Lyophyllum shimeji]